MTTLKGIGQRITLTNEAGETLADYIIGKKVEGEENAYYVRKAKPLEDEVYITELDINLSAKFSDWIEDDLLKLDRGDLAEIVVDKYSSTTLSQAGGTFVDRETSTLSREKIDG